MLDQLSAKARQKMGDTIKSLSRDLASISTGRAHPAALDTVRVEAYGSYMPISQVASVSTPDATTIAVQVWDKEMVKAVEKGITNADLGFNPMVDGQMLRISVPKLSEERRTELSKLSKKYGEDKKIAIRNIRRDLLDELKKDEEHSSKDKIHEFTDIIQEITDEHVTNIDSLVSVKEKELMKV